MILVTDRGLQTYTHTYIHTYIQVDMDRSLHTHTHTYIHTYIHAYIQMDASVVKHDAELFHFLKVFCMHMGTLRHSSRQITAVIKTLPESIGGLTDYLIDQVCLTSHLIMIGFERGTYICMNKDTCAHTQILGL